ncbi:MAG: hemerythrin domain-containing protein [Proteobacteria bacterium]|nr:hemerythrin domain-containing protein [Pseudomonadota bacterium]MBU1596760.1 hemerythrin domain-containing protein [Pseudomonadota bacterium]
METRVNLWKPEYQLDIEVIDDQHRGFFDLCMKSDMLCEAAQTRPVQLQDLVHLIYAMRAYAFKHFHAEETLLLKYGYPRIYPHIRQHDVFLGKLQEFTAKLNDLLAASPSTGQEAFLDSAKGINDYLADWWGRHILSMDLDYASFIREHKGAKA